MRKMQSWLHKEQEQALRFPMSISTDLPKGLMNSLNCCCCFVFAQESQGVLDKTRALVWGGEPVVTPAAAHSAKLWLQKKPKPEPCSASQPDVSRKQKAGAMALKSYPGLKKKAVRRGNVFIIPLTPTALPSSSGLKPFPTSPNSSREVPAVSVGQGDDLSWRTLLDLRI